MGGTFSVSDEFSTVGSKSLKVVKSVDVVYPISNSEIGRTFTISGDLNPKTTFNCYMSYRDNSSSAHILSTLILPANQVLSTSLSILVPDDAMTIFLRFEKNSGNIIFIDNLQLKIQ